jgi:signal transduction histidine kinase
VKIPKAALLGAVLLAVASLSAAAARDQPKRVLILHSYLPAFESGFGDKLRSELDRQLSGQLELYEDWLVSARFNEQGDDIGFANYLTTAFANRPIDLVIAMGTPAVEFLQRHRQVLFPSTPKVLTLVEQRRVPLDGPNENQVTVAYTRAEQVIINEILETLPRTSTLVLLLGNSPIEHYWQEQIRSVAERFNTHVTVQFLDSLPSFDDVLQRVASLPPHSAIYFEPFFPDIPGMPSDELAALAKLHAAANAPIFSEVGYYFGKGIVGGTMLFYDEYARETAEVATQILGGSSPSAIKVQQIRPQDPKFDWRELKRWGIREASLPSRSEIHFREQTIWEQYPREIASAVILFLIQAALILGLLYQRRRRKSAEIEAHQRLFELARINRRSVAGELSASLAHELFQPLTSIVTNTNAADLMLERSLPSEDFKEVLVDIKKDAQRAGEVIERLRRMLVNNPTEAQDVDLNEAVKETLRFLYAQASARRAVLVEDLSPLEPNVVGDRIQLQQIIMNLVLNALEAVGTGKDRKVVVRTVLLDESWAEVSVEDSGPGIPSDRLEQVFEPFYTTKESGMGMGLSITRTIVEYHGGEIRAENRSAGGALFRFSLRLSKTQSHDIGRLETR